MSMAGIRIHWNSFVPFFHIINKGINSNYIPSLRSVVCVYSFMMRVYILFFVWVLAVSGWVFS